MKTKFDTIVIGAGQAGLSVGYFLARQGRDFVILDANQRVGDSWRNRWDSLHLFTPARFDGLVGMPFPAPANSFPSKDEMADFLESYALHFNLPVRLGVRVDRLSKQGDMFVVTAGDQCFEAENVVVAMSSYQKPTVPPFAVELDPGIVQLHSSDYRNPSQLRDGAVLIVGAGNSGAEIAVEVARDHPTWLAGRDVGQVPFRIEEFASRPLLPKLLFRGLFHRILTVDTPVGRRIRPGFLRKGGMLIRVKAAQLAALGVERVQRVLGVRGGLPLLEDNRALDVANVIWCTGFTPGFSWIDLPVMGEVEPLHKRGVVEKEPGLYFVGLAFQYSYSSTMIYGVERDADYIAKQIAMRSKSSIPETTPQLHRSSARQ